jgi:hypothetical protein
LHYLCFLALFLFNFMLIILWINKWHEFLLLLKSFLHYFVEF